MSLYSHFIVRNVARWSNLDDTKSFCFYQHFYLNPLCTVQSGWRAQSLGAAAEGWASPPVQLWGVSGSSHRPDQRCTAREERHGKCSSKVRVQIHCIVSVFCKVLLFINSWIDASCDANFWSNSLKCSSQPSVRSECELNVRGVPNCAINSSSQSTHTEERLFDWLLSWEINNLSQHLFLCITYNQQ